MVKWYLRTLPRFGCEFDSRYPLHLISSMKKTENFPSINCTSLRESADRRAFIEAQCLVYGINRANFYITDRFVDIDTNLEISGNYAYSVIPQAGTIISHINLLRNWYNSCNEPYAIFCEDDISLESIAYWNFTWTEFMDNLPADWECVHLMRIVSPFDGDTVRLKVEPRCWWWWGAHGLMRRSYVKKILDHVCLSSNSYKLEMGDLQPIIENMLFSGYLGTVYNFPMLVEHEKFNTTYPGKGNSLDHEESHKYVLNLWRTQGLTLSINDIKHG